MVNESKEVAGGYGVLWVMEVKEAVMLQTFQGAVLERVMIDRMGIMGPQTRLLRIVQWRIGEMWSQHQEDTQTDWKYCWLYSLGV